ncbi:cobalt-zinc-cadmium efflux system protein [Paraburkholderia caballeronis]|uniref:cation diffusion facilitator family transporter n=1 Tax=Paraburkholderia caballeronis TaxID=416943 RepID=UPI0010ED547C|nr:cation diffusion facilitator family transporter [Paraburkholderia caballeronis]TDV25890.1 cobalt-zinc-cadmium efflux system protein [Paraburkholderia caballeronis]
MMTHSHDDETLPRDDAGASRREPAHGGEPHAAHPAHGHDHAPCDAGRAHDHRDEDGEHDHSGHAHGEHDHSGHAHDEHDHTAHAPNDHGHAGHHHHHHAPADGHGRAFAIAVALNVVIVVTQGIYGVIAQSTALLADAGHNLSDVLGLLLAWGAARLVTRRPSGRYTFGFGSTSILAALANAALLLVACGAIIAEAVNRLIHPQPVAGFDVFVVATIGMVVNAFSAWLFMRGQEHDLNIRGAFLHMAADAGVSAAVAISGLVILGTGWTWVDPLMSIAVVLVILYGTWGLLRESTRLALAAVPSNVDMGGIRAFLAAQHGVTDVHDLHVWALSTTGNALSVHLVMPAGHPGDAALDRIVSALRMRFSMQHVTLQVDLGTSEHRCSLDAPQPSRH